MQLFPNAVRLNARKAAAAVAALTLSASLLVAGVLAGGPALAEDAPAPADDATIGMSAEPLNEEGAAVRSRFDYQASPGQMIDDSYVVTNTGTTAQTYAVFATDAFNTEDGSFSLLDTGIEPSDAGAWVSFGTERSISVELQPAESKSIPFTLRVPDNATPGDHAAGLVVSLQTGDGQVLMDRRLGTRLYVRVPGELQPNLTITGITAAYTPSFNPLAGETTVTFTVQNAGNVALAGQLKTEIKGFFGITLASPTQQDVSEMLPGSTRTVTAVVPGVGQWLFLNPVTTLYPSVDETALNPGPLASVTRDTVVIAVPWVLLAIIVLGLLIWAWIWFGRKRNARRTKAWIEYTEAEARRKADADREPVGALAGDTDRAGS
ncbi:WxL protein peptidoglycan domain-containing protein [Microbacterium sp. P07]|uniref:WxL protein peptidoglycan domain-containing protein n=1 Tax=Microbacterium sp. P07 TaxID=3366952 RepID=UPI0037470750